MSNRLERIKRQMEPCDACKRNRFTAPEWLDDKDVVWLIGEVVRTENENTKLKDQLAHANATVAAAEEHITELKRELFKERKALTEAKGRLGIVEDMCRTVTQLRNSYKLDGGKL